MALQELTSREAVLAALAECRALGRDAFLRKYNLNRARRYLVRHNNEFFDAKALICVAFGVQYPEQGPLPHTAFIGREATVKIKLEALGFEVVTAKSGVATEESPHLSARRNFTPRPFDETREPSPFVPGDTQESLEETLARKEKAVVDHHRLLAALNRALWVADWSLIEEMPGAVDLWARRPGDTRRVIFEAKTLMGANEVHQTRSGLSQLLEYRHFYGEPDDLLCLVTNAPVSDARERFLRAQGVAVLTYDGTTFKAAGSLTLEMVGALGQRKES
ncbi:hypothetical protein [Corallococcus sp. M7]